MNKHIIHNMYTGKVIGNASLTDRVFLLNVQITPDFFDSYRPGKFCMVRVSDTLDPLLNRPFSISFVDTYHFTFSILYQVVGKGTQILSRKKNGDLLYVTPPLGNGFPMDVLEASPAIFLGGGIGIAPLLSVISFKQFLIKKSPFFWGVKSMNDFFHVKKVNRALEKLSISVASEDGSLGRKGTVLDLFRTHIQNMKGKPVVCACGPIRMLHSLQKLCSKQDLDLYVSLESRMACGIGFCLGCAIPSLQGNYLRACQEGPVFNAKSLLWKHIHDFY